MNEIQEQLLIQHSMQISLPTLSHTLNWLHFSHKDISGHALEQNNQVRAVFMNQIADQVPNPNMLIFEDEALKDERTLACRQGWALKGS